MRDSLMDTIHDLGGREGFGPICLQDNNDSKPFHELWRRGLGNEDVNVWPASQDGLVMLIGLSCDRIYPARHCYDDKLF